MGTRNLPAENQRIKEIMEKEGCTPAVFADTIQIDRATISNILNGRTNSRGEKYYPPPSMEVFQHIRNTYKNINLDWLLMGVLPMYKGDKLLLQPDLFSENPPNTNYVTEPKENSQETKVEKPENSHKNAVIQEVIPPISTNRKIDKIMIFYSDRTFDSFSPDGM